MKVWICFKLLLNSFPRRILIKDLNLCNIFQPINPFKTIQILKDLSNPNSNNLPMGFERKLNKCVQDTIRRFASRFKAWNRHLSWFRNRLPPFVPLSNDLCEQFFFPILYEPGCHMLTRTDIRRKDCVFIKMLFPEALFRTSIRLVAALAVCIDRKRLLLVFSSVHICVSIIWHIEEKAKKKSQNVCSKMTWYIKWLM